MTFTAGNEKTTSPPTLLRKNQNCYNKMASQRKLHVLIFELAPFAFHKLSCDACMLFSVYVCVCVRVWKSSCYRWIYQHRAKSMHANAIHLSNLSQSILKLIEINKLYSSHIAFNSQNSMENITIQRFVLEFLWFKPNLALVILRFLRLPACLSVHPPANRLF